MSKCADMKLMPDLHANRLLNRPLFGSMKGAGGEFANCSCQLNNEPRGPVMNSSPILTNWSWLASPRSTPIGRDNDNQARHIGAQSCWTAGVANKTDHCNLYSPS